jgi:hypothetical protein
LATNANTLNLHIEATDEEDLRRIQDIVTSDFDRFSHRDPLTLNWQRLEAASNGTDGKTPAPIEKPATRPRYLNLRTIGLAIVVALAVAVHLGLGGALLADFAWTSWAANGVLGARPDKTSPHRSGPPWNSPLQSRQNPHGPPVRQVHEKSSIEQ